MVLILTLCMGPPAESHMWGRKDREAPRPAGNVPEGLSCQLHITHIRLVVLRALGRVFSPLLLPPAPPPLTPLLFLVMRGKQEGDDNEPWAKALFLFLLKD